MNFSWAVLGWIALGGAAGSVARGLVAMALPSRFPWATLLINVAGSILIGWLMARIAGLEPEAAVRWRAFLVVGVCGGFTTFSTFSWQTFEQMQRGEWGAATANIMLSFALCLLGTWLGFRLGQA